VAAVLARSSITGLDLGSNFIGGEGAKALAEVLSSTSITTLNLDDNAIGDEGVAALAAGTKASPITNLNLASNHFGDEGATALSEVLADSCIAWLDLDFNSIGDMGEAALADVVVKTPRFSCAMPEFCSKLWPEDGSGMFKIWCDRPNRYCDKTAVFGGLPLGHRRVHIFGCDDRVIMIMEGEMAGFDNFPHEPFTSSGWHISGQALAAATKAGEEDEAYVHQLNKRRGQKCPEWCVLCEHSIHHPFGRLPELDSAGCH